MTPRRIVLTPVALWAGEWRALSGARLLLSIEVNFGFGLSSQQSILDHVKQQLLNSLLQRDALLGTQKHSRHGDFSSRFPHNMARLRIPELQPQSQRGQIGRASCRERV